MDCIPTLASVRSASTLSSDSHHNQPILTINCAVHPRNVFTLLPQANVTATYHHQRNMAKQQEEEATMPIMNMPAQQDHNGGPSSSSSSEKETSSAASVNFPQKVSSLCIYDSYTIVIVSSFANTLFSAFLPYLPLYTANANALGEGAILQGNCPLDVQWQGI
jgi:hypothetical protein